MRIGCAEEPGGGHGGLKGKYEENQISAIDAMPGRSRKRSGTVSVVTVFRSVFADPKDVDEKVSELSALSLGYLPLAYALDESEYLPRRQRSEGQKPVEEIVVGHGRVNYERRTAS
jgi:hypothetical protein